MFDNVGRGAQRQRKRQAGAFFLSICLNGTFMGSLVWAGSRVVEEVKKTSSKWIKTQGHEFAAFAWQAGYGAFAVSESNIAAVRDYIAGQQEHHRKKTFQEEYRAFLERHRVAFDERYMWD